MQNGLVTAVCAVIDLIAYLATVSTLLSSGTALHLTFCTLSLRDCEHSPRYRAALYGTDY